MLTLRRGPPLLLLLRTQRPAASALGLVRSRAWLSSSSSDTDNFKRAGQSAAQNFISKISGGTSWREAMNSGLAEQQKSRQQDQVRTRMISISEKEEYSFNDLETELKDALNELENGLTSPQRVRLWADTMSGGTMKETIDKQKEDTMKKLKIIGEFNEHERRVPRLLNWKARQQIAEKLEIGVDEVSECIFNFQLQHAQWTFLRRERLRGRPLPTTAQEMEWMVQKRPTKEFVRVMKAFGEMKDRLEKERNKELDDE